MRQQVEETVRDAILVEDAARIRMMGMPVLEALPSRTVPYEQVDPFKPRGRQRAAWRIVAIIAAREVSSKRTWTAGLHRAK